MKPTEPFTCRECGVTPERRGDAVASSALAYTCSLCLCTGHRREIPATNATTQGTSKSPSPERASSVESAAIDVTLKVDEAYRKAHPRGRHRKHSTRRVAHAEAQRAYRERKA